MKKILIIDDNAEFRTMVSDYFMVSNYLVVAAPDGLAGVKAAEKEKPDIILLDIMMPGKAGIEVLRELQCEPETSKIPVIVITGTYFEKGVSQLFKLEQNCKEFYPKTVDLALLQKKVEEITGKK